MSRISNQSNLPRIVGLLVALAVMLGWATPVHAAQAFTATFPANTPTQFVSGSVKDLAIMVRGLPARGDVLVLAWSESRSRMIDSFAHELRAQPWKITARQLEKLPDGRNHIQLLTRVNGQVQAKVSHVIDKVTVTPTNYTIAFAASSPDQHTIGGGQTVALTVPALPPSGDVLVQAWHLGQNRLVPEFAHEINAAPYQITAAKLDLLPPGQVELQVMIRAANKPIVGDKKTITVAQPTQLPTLSFSGAPDTYTVGAGGPVAIAVNGELPSGAKLIVQAWDEEAQALVSAFTHELAAEPFQIDSAKLNTLPAGTVRLQALLRYQGEVRQTVGQTVEIVRGPVEPVLPTLSFTGAPQTYEVGSNQAITVTMTGALPTGGDVIVLAWSDEEKRMVNAFAQTFTAGPITIPAAKIDGLPAGEVQLQAIVRVNNQVKARVTHDMQIEEPVTEPDPTKASIAFAPGTPAAYTVESGEPIYFNINGTLAEDEDVLAIAWSTEQNKLVDFNRVFVSAPHRIEAAWLDTFPSGAVQLQLLLRKNNVIIQKATHWVLIVRPGGNGGNGGEDPGNGGEDPGNGGEDPGNGGEDPGNGGEDPGNGGEDPGNGGTDPGTGWTTFSKASDTRVIYVAANGSDSNDGLSESKPVKSPDKAYSLIRDNSADWILFRRGDKFDLPANTKGDFRGWAKSGRSASQKIVVGAYGDDSKARPVLNSNSRGVLSVNGGQVVEHVAFVDLHFYANQRDPSSPDFNGGGTYEYGMQWNQGGGGDILFEGVLIEYFANNISMGAPAGKSNGPENVIFRRCVIRRSYSHVKDGHSQGAGFGNMSGFTLDSCIFDRNGYEPRVSASKRTGFNHGMYLYHTKNVTIANCFFSRNGYGGVKGRGDREGDIKNVVVRDSVFTDELVGLYIMGDNSSGDPNAMVNHDIIVKANLFTRIGGEMDGTKHGFGTCYAQIKNGTLESNLFVHKTMNTNWPAMELQADKPHQNYVVKKNVIHNWPRTYSNDEVWIRSVSSKTTLQSNLAFQKDSLYVDASRTMEKYAKSVGYSNVDAFCDAVAGMRKGNWPAKLGSGNVLTYFRNGFALRPAD